MKIEETYSQFGEDLAIAAVLRGSGLPFAPWFVDVGANDGKSWSNSWLFGLHGWRLLLIEPIPRYAEHCRMHHGGNPRVVVEEKAIAPVKGPVDFFVTDDPDRDLLQMSSSLTREGVSFGLASKPITVEATPLEDLLRAHQVPRDYGVLSVDAEGHDLAVLQTAALDRWSPRLICVELANEDAPDRIIADYLGGYGYRHAISTSCNAIYLRDDGLLQKLKRALLRR